MKRAFWEKWANGRTFQDFPRRGETCFSSLASAIRGVTVTHDHAADRQRMARLRGCGSKGSSVRGERIATENTKKRGRIGKMSGDESMESGASSIDKEIRNRGVCAMICQFSLMLAAPAFLASFGQVLV